MSLYASAKLSLRDCDITQHEIDIRLGQLLKAADLACGIAKCATSDFDEPIVGLKCVGVYRCEGIVKTWYQVEVEVDGPNSADLEEFLERHIKILGFTDQLRCITRRE